MTELLTPKQVALALGVSEASLKRWCDKGLIPTIRTAGGHRRLPINGVFEFLRDRGRVLVRPEVLGLPAATGASDASFERMRGLMREAIEAGDPDRCRRLTFNLYLGGKKAWEICDRVIAPALHDIGSRWSHGETEIYHERRGIEMCRRMLHDLREVLAPPTERGCTALGATLSGDPYSLATMMVEIAMRENGWAAMSYGTDLPASALRSAIRDVRPRVFWLSVSTIPDEEQFLADYASVYEMASVAGSAVVVGGRALNSRLREQMQYASYCDTLGHLVAFAASLQAPEPSVLQDPRPA
jgi:excisionase family DNA binding protein